MAANPPVITFVSDYGLDDDFVGICHAVIAGICPQARVIDLVHWVPPHDVRAGAVILRGALPYLPVGVHLAVVDPGVGTDRRAVAVRVADGRLLVGPDNGLLSLAADRAAFATELAGAIAKELVQQTGGGNVEERHVTLVLAGVRFRDLV